jgi:hypothetical protein
MQDLLNHTIHRIFKISAVSKIIEMQMEKFEMTYKLGCDSSSGQSQYKVKFNTSTPDSDCTVFMFSLVPLQLHGFKDDKIVVILNNPHPSSTRFCRPIKFTYKKETIENTKQEVGDIEDQLNNGILTDIILEGRNIQIEHKLLFTMVDGKVK